MRTIPQISGALHFSTRGEYGVRLMVELARHHGTGPVSLADVSDHEDLPRPYLEQLVISLREAGLVVSTRGARGGYELARDAHEIRMSQVIEALEGPISPMVCATDHGDRARADPASPATGPRSATSSRCGSGPRGRHGRPGLHDPGRPRRARAGASVPFAAHLPLDPDGQPTTVHTEPVPHA